MNPEMKIIREVHIQAENFYNDAVKLGDHAAYVARQPARNRLRHPAGACRPSIGFPPSSSRYSIKYG